MAQITVKIESSFLVQDDFSEFGFTLSLTPTARTPQSLLTSKRRLAEASSLEAKKTL